MDLTSVGARIRRQREYLGMTRETLAKKLEVTPKFCSDIELGVRGMSIQTLCKISKALNLSADYILFGKKSDEHYSPATDMLKTCPENKLPHLEKIIKEFLFAVSDD